MQYFSNKIKFLIISLVGFLALMSTPVLALGVLQNIDGFPIMPNFTEVEQSSLFFDKPEGRVLEVLVVGSSSFAEVIDFYKESLAHIGWVAAPIQVASPHTLYFIKEGERLTLELSEKNNEINIHIFLVPTGSP